MNRLAEDRHPLIDVEELRRVSGEEGLQGGQGQRCMASYTVPWPSDALVLNSVRLKGDGWARC